ncbi:hypothetical protein ACLKA7_010337 [Drosophila subpalustris]
MVILVGSCLAKLSAAEQNGRQERPQDNSFADANLLMSLLLPLLLLLNHLGTCMELTVQQVQQHDKEKTTLQQQQPLHFF